MAKVHSTRGITDLAIRQMKKGAADLTDIGENQGLRVAKGKTGLTSFIYRYRSPSDGRLKQVKIGAYPAISLAEARMELGGLKTIRAKGDCPASIKKQERKARKTAQTEYVSSLSVIDIMEIYLSEYIEDRYDCSGQLIRAGARKLKGQREVRSLLMGSPSQSRRKDGQKPRPMLAQLLGDIPAVELIPKNVSNAVMEVVDRGSNVSAGNMLREFAAALDYSIGDGLPDDYVNPCYQVKAMLARKKVKLTSRRRKRVLNDTELSMLLDWLPNSKYTSTQKSVLMITLMTGCRTGEIVAAEWKDIDLDRGIWALKQNKTDMPRDVQLSRQATAFLTQLKLITGKYVCPSQKTGKPIQQKSLTEQAWHMRRDGNMLDIDHWTPHDLRRSVRTGLARLGCPEAVAEAILGHEKSGIVGVYNLHSYTKECRQWLQLWCDHMDGLRNG